MLVPVLRKLKWLCSVQTGLLVLIRRLWVFLSPPFLRWIRLWEKLVWATQLVLLHRIVNTWNAQAWITTWMFKNQEASQNYCSKWEKGCKQDAHVLLIAANQKPAAGKSTTWLYTSIFMLMLFSCATSVLCTRLQKWCRRTIWCDPALTAAIQKRIRYDLAHYVSYVVWPTVKHIMLFIRILCICSC